MSVLLRPVQSSPDAFEVAVDLYSAHRELDASDALLLGTADSIRAIAVITDDAGFLSQDLVRVVMLSDSDGIAALLGSLA